MTCFSLLNIDLTFRYCLLYSIRQLFPIIVALIVLVFAGCLHVPGPVDNNSTLLIVDRQMSKSSRAAPIYRYKFVFEDEITAIDPFLPANDLLFIEGLPVGEYRIVAIEEIKPDSGELINEFLLNTTVVLNPGHYSILDFTISTRIIRGFTTVSNYTDRQDTNVNYIDKQRREEIIEAIAGSKNGVYWSSVQ